ncbi:hypothetical protein CERSUDRAFT_124975 [Gelatoporia subvermispora B]|uniref:Oxidase ustYa n=1 Tax=Ceriporiopsis subvermispora (strain B) TaxID=914234 RepID=M2PG74_CERS8|nr:hypothetical protein CERSUDRAFT_124975 [Gelatoporia subvermispora B]
MVHYVRVPTIAAVLALSALGFSVLVHITTICLQAVSIPSYNGINAATLELSINLREAAMTIVKSPRFGLFSNESDWTPLLPRGEGFLYHPDTDAHFLVSHYHQLHCIRSLRHYFNKRDSLDAMDIGHVNHCLIYLRQMVLCNVDMTLEPATHKQLAPDGRVTNAVTGVDVTHRCKDWAQLREYMEDNYEQWKGTYE